MAHPESQLAALILSQHSAIVVEDADRRVLLVNQAFCDLFSVPALPEALKGADCAEAARQSAGLFADPDGFLTRIDEILARGAPVRDEELQMADGRIVQRDYVPVDEEGRSIGRMWVYRDVTGERRRTERLEALSEELARANRVKSEFMAIMSHEIRTPMNAILGMTELVLGTGLDREQRGLLMTVKSNADALLGLIEQILDHSRLEGAGVELERAPFSLPDLVEGVVEALAPRAFAKDVELVMELSHRLPEALLGDAGRIRQIVVNLAGNAVKFTSSGRVVVRCSYDPHDEVALLEVEDTGPGIPLEDQDRIFEPFVQLRDITTPSAGGTGLGLGITRELTERMGGRMTLASTPGEGATFRVRLPLPTSDHRFPRRRVSDRRFPEVHVDVGIADPALASSVEMLAGALGTRGDAPGDPTSATLPHRVLAVILDEPPERAREQIVRHRERFGPRAPVLVLHSPTHRPPESARAADDATWWRGRPLTRRTLAEVLDDVVSGRSALEEEAGQTPGPAPAPAPGGPTVLLVEDNEASRLYATRVLEGGGHAVVAATNGHEALAFLAEHRVSAIVTDVQMPEMDGLELVRRVRAAEGQKGGPHTPIIVVTAHAGDEHRRASLEAGADEHLEKPFAPDALRAAVDRVLASLPVVLVLDDDPDSTFLATRWLSQRRVRVIRAHTLAEARTALLDRRPDLLLCDLNLPDGDPVALLGELESGGQVLPPAIAVTGDVTARTRRREVRDRYREVLTKPYTREALLAAVDRMLDADPGGEVEGTSGSEVGAPPPASEHVEVDPDIADLVPEYLDARRRDVAALVDEVMDRTPTPDGWERVRIAGHNIKGTGQGYGFRRLSELGARIEAAAKATSLPAARSAVAELEAWLAGVEWSVRG